MTKYQMTAHQFIGLRQKEELKNACWGAGEEERRFWQKRHQAKSISGLYQYIHKSYAGGLSPVMMGLSCNSCLSGTVDGLWGIAFACSLPGG